MKYKSNNLEIGNMIYERINPIVPTYPIIADKGSTYPFSVYRRTYFRPSYTKDRNDFQDTVGIEILVCTNTYKESILLAQKIKDELELLRGRWKDTIVVNIDLIDSNEYWNEDAYVQRMIFEIQIDSTPENY